METANISAEIIGILGGLVALTPLIKAISHWHIEFRKISPKEKTATALQPQISKAEVSGRGFRMVMLISSFIGGCMGLYLLIKQSMGSGPVTSGSMAETVLAVVYIYLGWIKKQPWEDG
jgi:hypothetical protein